MVVVLSIFTANAQKNKVPVIEMPEFVIDEETQKVLYKEVVEQKGSPGTLYDKALAWADQSIAAQQNFNNLNLKSQIQAALGQSGEAVATMELALNDPGAGAPQYYTYGRQLIGEDKDKEAMEIFTTLSKKWPEHWLSPHGMARGYSAAGDYKKALKYEKEALNKCPEGSKQFLTGYVAKLENGEDFN